MQKAKSPRGAPQAFVNCYMLKTREGRRRLKLAFEMTRVVNGDDPLDSLRRTGNAAGTLDRPGEAKNDIELDHHIVRVFCSLFAIQNELNTSRPAIPSLEMNGTFRGAHTDDKVVRDLVQGSVAPLPQRCPAGRCRWW